MAKKSLADFLSGNRALGSGAQNHLRQLVERYPYYHVVRLLYLRCLFLSHDETFAAELRKAALYVPSRRVLYKLIEGERLNPSRSDSSLRTAPRVSSTDDRTESLIAQFLESLPEQKPPRHAKVDASVDYIEFLRQNEADSSVLSQQSGSEEQSASGSLIDEFLDNQGRLVLHNRNDEEMLKPLSSESEGGGDAVLTEVMARIYIKQQKFDQALEIIQKLSLKYPKKNRYFADQIRFLEKLIINNKNK